MAALKFMGEINSISDQQFNLIREVLHNHDFSDETVAVENVGKKGDNYVAAVKRIMTQKIDESNFKMIAEIAPKLETERQLMNAKILFRNEITMYNEVLPKFEEYMQISNLNSDERFKIAKCYGFSGEAPNEIILLEDMCVSNFEMLDRLAPLSNECVKLVLKDLAIYHSLSYLMRERDPDTFQKLNNKLPNVWVSDDVIEDMKIWMEQLESDVIAVMSDEKYNGFIKDIIANFTGLAKKLHTINMESKHSVITHGDCWTNNILFRMKNGNPLESCMIDYQLSKPASPVEDIHYVTFICTNYANRSKHFNEWMDHYHAELDRSLTNFGMSVNRIYPRDQLNADLKRYGKFIIATTIIISDMISRESDETENYKDHPDLERTNDEIMDKGNAFRIINVKEDTKERFRNRIKDCIDSALELGYI